MRSEVLDINQKIQIITNIDVDHLREENEKLKREKDELQKMINNL